MAVASVFIVHWRFLCGASTWESITFFLTKLWWGPRSIMNIVDKIKICVSWLPTIYSKVIIRCTNVSNNYYWHFSPCILNITHLIFWHIQNAPEWLYNVQPRIAGTKMKKFERNLINPKVSPYESIRFLNRQKLLVYNSYQIWYSWFK